MSKKDISSVQKALEKIIGDSDFLEHKNLKSLKLEEIKNEWFYYALSYLNAADALADLAIKENTFRSKMLVIPALYNFKHGIELSLKYLYKSTNAKFDKNHDIASLYQAVLDKLKKHTGLKIRDYVRASNLRYLTEENLGEIINENIEHLSAIINKYYFQTPLKKILANDDFFIRDQGNELFKYPEATNVTFYFKSIRMLNMPKEDLKLIKKNIEKMIFIITLYFSFFNPKQKILNISNK